MKTFKGVLKIAFFVLLILIFIGVMYVFDLFRDEDLRVLKDEDDQTILNALVLGYDAGVDGTPRPDTILLANIDMGKRAVGIVSLPRDTRVAVPGYDNKYKLNSSYALGGIDLLKETVADLLGIPVHCYVEVDFHGFEKIIDILGGVEIEVHEHMKYTDEAGDLYIDIEPGLQVLDGKEALNYVRYREPLQADIGRIGRQQQFINALLDEVLTMKVIPKIPSLLGEIGGLINTNLLFKDMARLAKMAAEVPRDQIELIILPGTPEYINDVSYWVADEESLDRTLLSLVYTKDYLENAQYEVVLLNGSGISGLAGQTRDKLRDWGFKVERIGNADRFDYSYTTIYFGDGDLEGALRISSIIGGYPERKEDMEKGRLEIILGKDQSP